jgi:hypothetical protein
MYLKRNHHGMRLVKAYKLLSSLYSLYLVILFLLIATAHSWLLKLMLHSLN